MGSNNIINDYIAGALGGAAGLVIGHPFDTTKVQLQTKQTSAAYAGTIDAMKHIKHHGWVRGFFRGMGFPLASYGVVNSVFFGVYGHTLRTMKGDAVERRPTYGEAFTAGCVGGFFQLFVACPVDVIKVVLQAQISKTSEAGLRAVAAGGSTPYFRGPVSCAAWLVRRHGVRGLYYGFNSMLLRDVPTFGVYTLVYEWLYDRIQDLASRHAENVPRVQPLEPIHANCSATSGTSSSSSFAVSSASAPASVSALASLLAGGCAGTACWMVAIPFDNVKSRLQSDTSQKVYRSTWHCIRQLYATKGPSGFFTGFQICCLRAFPVNAVTFLVYSQTMTLLARNNNRSNDLQ